MTPDAGLLRKEGVLNNKFLGIEKGMSSSQFCFVPYGTVGGYGGRYLPATLFGCIPVIWQVNKKLRTALPFEELPDVDWSQCSITTQENDIADLDKRLDSSIVACLDDFDICFHFMQLRLFFLDCARQRCQRIIHIACCC